METQEDRNENGGDKREKALNKKLEAVAWGLFVITIGVLLLVPEDQRPETAWLVGAGTIMLALNLVRYLVGIKLSAFTIVLGLVALTIGVLGLYEIKKPVFPIIVIAIGLIIIVKPLVCRDGKFVCPCFGKKDDENEDDKCC